MQDASRPSEAVVTVSEERAVSRLVRVPVERVRLRTETVEGQERVTERVQREQIVLDESPAPRVTPR